MTAQLMIHSLSSISAGFPGFDYAIVAFVNDKINLASTTRTLKN